MASFFKTNILMCKPNYYGVSYEINPWMDVEKKVDYKLAQQQWTALHHLIIRCGGYVRYVDPQQGLPDMVFTANAAVRYGNKAFISRFRHKERQGEEAHFLNKLSKMGFDVCSSSAAMEGAGDALFAGDTLFVGYGFRSDLKAWTDVQEFFGIDNLVYCHLNNPYFYHLDTCFCPLDEELGFFYPDAFENPDVLRSEMDLFEVPKEEAELFACNAVIIDDNVIMPSGCEKTAAWLSSKRMDVYMTPMTEFIKAGGACKCLTLDLGMYNEQLLVQ